MVATIQQIIGKINLELYAENGKDLLKKYKTADKIPVEEVKPKNLAEHKIVYDSTTETLEPVYFFTIDMMSNDFGLETEKIVDNFSSTPGSAHFAELGQRATIMQQNATKILGDVNNVMRSILNIIYDLREFKIRLKSYDDFKSKDKSTSEAALLSLKQIWMDRVDIQKGNSSIKAMALGQAGYQTLIDAFLIVKDESLKDSKGNEIDLNDRVKRIVKSRVIEFNSWLKESEGELRKRYELEKNYLKSQVNSLKIYSRWAKPYLKAAQELEMKDVGRKPDFVKTFNTIILELTVMGKSKLKPEDLILSGDLPRDFKKLKLARDYFVCILVNFSFRGITQKAGQQYVFGGKTEIIFNAYALNKDELDAINKEMEKSDISDAMKLVEGITTGSLEQLQKDIDYFLEEKTEEEKKDSLSSMKSTDFSNPFVALIGGYGKSESSTSSEKSKPDEKKEEVKKIRPDDWIEKNHLRKIATNKAKETAFTIFDVYKQAHGMVSYT